MAEISILDYGVGNLASIANMVRHIGGSARIISNPAEVGQSERLLLPGVGAWDVAMTEIDRRNLRAPLSTFAAGGRPLLGICLGMQILFEASEEGSLAGLGLIPGQVKRFADTVRVPHMGWNIVRPGRETPLFPPGSEELRFYFAHSYYAQASHPADVVASAEYGQVFGCAFNRGHVFGTQFHPEKSHRFGMSLLGSFLTI